MLALFGYTVFLFMFFINLCNMQRIMQETINTTPVYVSTQTISPTMSSNPDESTISKTIIGTLNILFMCYR